jgi:hypothetical protein
MSLDLRLATDSVREGVKMLSGAPQLIEKVGSDGLVRIVAFEQVIAVYNNSPPTRRKDTCS